MPDPITENIRRITTHIESIKTRCGIPYPIELVAVTKYATVSQIRSIIKAGITTLGENKVQDALRKQAEIQDPAVKWHLLGHLQSNKITKAVVHFDMIQSADSLDRIRKIDEAAKKAGKILPILAQVNMTQEPSKSGFTQMEIETQATEIFSFHNAPVIGIMAIGPNITNPLHIRRCFQHSKQLYTTLQEKYPLCRTLSMGMSHDYEIAIEEGSTMVRIGSAFLESSNQ